MRGGRIAIRVGIPLIATIAMTACDPPSESRRASTTLDPRPTTPPVYVELPPVTHAPTTAPATAPATTTTTPSTIATVATADEAAAVVDRWIGGWNDDDPDQIVAVFTDDGSFEGWLSWEGERSGHPALHIHAEAYAGLVTVERTGNVVSVGPSVYSCPVRVEGREVDRTYVGYIMASFTDELVSSIEAHLSIED